MRRKCCDNGQPPRLICKVGRPRVNFSLRSASHLNCLCTEYRRNLGIARKIAARKYAELFSDPRPGEPLDEWKARQKFHRRPNTVKRFTAEGEEDAANRVQSAYWVSLNAFPFISTDLARR